MTYMMVTLAAVDESALRRLLEFLQLQGACPKGSPINVDGTTATGEAFGIAASRGPTMKWLVTLSGAIITNLAMRSQVMELLLSHDPSMRATARTTQGAMTGGYLAIILAQIELESRAVLMANIQTECALSAATDVIPLHEPEALRIAA